MNPPDMPSDGLSFFSLVSTLIALAAVSSFINYRYIRLPTTIGIMLVALVASLALIIAGPYRSDGNHEVSRCATTTRSSNCG